MKKQLVAPVSEPIIVNGQVSQAWLFFFVELANAVNQIQTKLNQDQS